MRIITGKIPGAKKVVIYGPEGIGKSTFASKFPEPVFIDTEGSTKEMDISRFERPSSWTMLLEEIHYVWKTPGICKTLVIDTIDWAEQMCVEDLCARYGKKGIEDFGYGNGYVYAKEEFGRFLNLLNEVVQSGVHVVLTAHTHIRKFEQPDEMGSYDRWELKLGKKTQSQTAPLVKEWADMVLFANYKTWSVAVDDKGKKRKAQGGARVMYTAHNPCWDAKNRYGLPEEVPFDYESIRQIIEPGGDWFAQAPEVTQPPRDTNARQVPTETESHRTERADSKEGTGQQAMTEPKFEAVQQTMDLGSYAADPGDRQGDKQGDMSAFQPSMKIPKALRDLMIENQVCEWDIQNVVAARGYYPPDTPVENYDPDFVAGVLVGAWPQVYGMIREMKEKEQIPFN